MNKRSCDKRRSDGKGFWSKVRREWRGGSLYGEKETVWEYYMGGETAVKKYNERHYMERVWEYYERENAGKKIQRRYDMEIGEYMRLFGNSRRGQPAGQKDTTAFMKRLLIRSATEFVRKKESLSGAQS